MLLAALCGAVLADADAGKQSAPGNPEQHLLLVPNTAAGVLAIERTDPRLVARYESFSLVEAAGEDDARLRAAGGDRRDDMREVATAAGQVDLATDRPSLAGKQAPDREEVLALVQFVGPPKDSWLQRLRATGVSIIGYQAENAYLVHADGGAAERLAALVGTDPAVRAVTPVTPADKVKGRSAGQARYAVVTLAGAAGADARDGSTTAAVGAQRVQERELSPSELDGLSRDPGVVAIEPSGEPRPADERAGQIVAGNLTGFQPSPASYLAWHDARFSPAFDQTIDFTDTGLDNGASPSDHPDFAGPGSGPSGDRVAYGADYTAPPPSGPDLDTGYRDCTGHGTNVASAAAGYNNGTAPEDQQGGFHYGLGLAPRAKIGVSKVFQDCSPYDGPDQDALPDHAFSLGGLTLREIASNAYDEGARIQNDSWGTGTFGDYSTRAWQYDQLVRDTQPGTPGYQEMVAVFAAGNHGDAIPGSENEGYASIAAEATAKNVITVGASENVRPSGNDGCAITSADADSARDVANFSSRGPTDDGRLKPDLVAPGTHITGARPRHSLYSGTNTCNPFFVGTYSMATGTSQAAPEVSAAAALVREWYTPTLGAPPSAAMTKALLLNSATDLAGGQNGKGGTIAAGPNADQGWGRVNVGAAVDSAPLLHDQDDVLGFSGDTSVRAFRVSNANQPVKITLVWTDPPGTVDGDAFVNNLDLEVGAGGQTYVGNVFGGSYSRTGGSADVSNNVESVYLPPGTSGPFSVTVRGTSIGGDGLPDNGDPTDQDFALVVSNATEQPAPVMVAGTPTVSGGDGDGALESDELVDVTQPVRNAGTDDSSGPVSATLSGTGGLAVTQASGDYPGLPSGASASNTPSFGVHLANAAPCGADATAALSIPVGSEAQSIPVLLPTGTGGPTQTNTAAIPSPLTIPDDSAAGVSSSIFIPERGRIKDIDVTIAAIDHPFVGDLEIDLIGPDGTTVRLVEHPGGPDNAEQDFTQTTFDDEGAQEIGDGSAPYSGTFKPQGDQLSRFYGKSRRGTWTLRVRDLFEGDVGTLGAWSVTTQKAVCDVDTTAPDTSIGGGPSTQTTSRSAQFTLSSSDAGATFECRLDGAAYAPCGATTALSGLGLGSHTLSARAIDGSDNEDPTPATYSWLVVSPPQPPQPPPPATPAGSFVLALGEQRLADVLGGHYSVLAACAGACRASAKLSVGASTARRLHLGRKATVLGQGEKRRSGSGTAKVPLRLSGKARAALRGRKALKATLSVTLSEGGGKLTMRRTVALRRAAGLERIASRGLKLWAVCARRCPLSVSLTLSAAQARRLGLKPGSAARLEVASGRITATRSPKTLALNVHRAARKALARARRVSALFEAVAGAPPDPLRTARLSTTLRR